MSKNAEQNPNRDYLLSKVVDNPELGISRTLSNAIIKHIGGATTFDWFFSHDNAVVDEDFYGFSGTPALRFYHEHKSDLLACVKAKSFSENHGTAFDWFEVEMNSDSYDRDAVAEAIHEPYTNNPSIKHLLVAGMAVRLAVNVMGERYKALLVDQQSMHSQPT